jgi:hypothetical protein
MEKFNILVRSRQPCPVWNIGLSLSLWTSLLHVGGPDKAKISLSAYSTSSTCLGSGRWGLLGWAVGWGRGRSMVGGVRSRYTERVFSKPSPLILSWDLRVRGQTSKSSNLLWANGGAYRAGGSYPLLAVKRMEAASCAHWRLSWLNLYLEIPVNSPLGPTWCQWFWSLFCTRPTLLWKR